MLRLPAHSRETTVEERKGVSFLVYFLFVHKNGKLGLDLGEPRPFLELGAWDSTPSCGPIVCTRALSPRPIRGWSLGLTVLSFNSPPEEAPPHHTGPDLEARLHRLQHRPSLVLGRVSDQTPTPANPAPTRSRVRSPHLAAQSQSHRSTPLG